MPNPVFYDSEVSFVAPASQQPDLGGGQGVGGAAAASQEPKVPEAVIITDPEHIEEIPLVLPQQPAAAAAAASSQTAAIEEPQEPTLQPPTPPSSSSSSHASVFAKTLAEEGVFTSFDETKFNEAVKTKGVAAALIDLNKQAIADGIEAYKLSLSPTQQKYLAALEKGIPAQDFLGNQMRQAKLAEIKDTDITANEELASTLVAEDLRARSYTPEEIAEELKTIKDLGQLGPRALKAHKFLVATEQQREQALVAQAEQRRQQAEAAAQEQLKTLRSTVDATKEIIPGMTITPTEKDTLYNLLTTSVKQTADGQYLNAIWAKRLENPMQFDTVLAYLFQKGVFNGSWDKIIKQTKTEAIKQLESVFDTGGDFRTGQPAPRAISENAKSILQGMASTFKQ